MMSLKFKIRTKIIAATAFFVTASLIISGFFTYDYAANIIREQSINDSQTQLGQISSQLERVQEQIIKTAEYIVSDEEINRRLSKRHQSTLEQDYFEMYEVQERLKWFTALNTYIYNVIIMRNDGRYFSNNSGYSDYFDSYLGQPWFQSLLENDVRAGFTIPHDFFYLNRDQQVLSYVVKYKNLLHPEDGEHYLILDINYADITNAFTQSLFGFEQLFLFNDAGEILFQGGSGTIDNESMVSEAMVTGEIVEDKLHIIIANNGKYHGWTQVAVISKEELFAEINKILHYYVLIIVSSLALMLLIILPIIMRMTKPLSSLVQAMKHVSIGNLDTSIKIKSGDELEVLGLGFNRMVAELKKYIQASIQDEAMKRDMQMGLLLSQINPHFIYNTLNTVIYLSHANRSKDAAQITEAMIDILQDTVKTGEGAFFSTLEEECKIVNKYIDIQYYRYPQRFQVQWNIDEHVQNAIIPKMIIQPLVENAIFHGLIPDEINGKVVISALKDNHDLLIQVSDNGIGMSEARQNEVFNIDKSGHQSDQVHGIGLANIQERIRYHYGDEYGLRITSNINEGTVIDIKLPFQEVLAIPENQTK